MPSSSLPSPICTGAGAGASGGEAQQILEKVQWQKGESGCQESCSGCHMWLDFTRVARLHRGGSSAPGWLICTGAHPKGMQDKSF
eukprot:488063-Pelagomonas_calceolata.AAC.3